MTLSTQNSNIQNNNHTEALLVEALLANNNQAYEQLVRQYGPKMYAVAYRFFGNVDQSQECLQKSFIQVFEKIASFRADAQLATWLHRITVNTALMMLRKQNQRPTLSLDDYNQHYNEFGERTVFADNSGNNIEHLFEKEQLKDNLKTIILSLPEKYCNVLLLRDIQELSTKETANILAISSAAVKTQLHRARLLLKEMLEANNVKMSKL